MDEKDAINKEIRVLGQSVTDAKNRHDAILSAINRSKEERDSLQNNIKILEDKKTKLEQIVRESETRAHTAGETLETVHRNLTDMQKEYDRLATEVLLTKESLELAKNKNLEEIAIEKEVARVSIRSERTRLSVMQGECEELKNTIAVLTVKHETADAQYRNLVSQKEATLAELGRLQAEIKDAQAQFSAENRKVTNAKNTLESITSDVQDKIVERDALEKEIGTLKNTVGIIKKEIEGLHEDTKIARAGYETTVALRVSLAEKQDELTQREEYIREKYKGIGLAYE